MSWNEIFFNDFIKLKRGYDLPNDFIIEGEFPVVASTSIKAYHKFSKAKSPGVVTGRSGSLGTVQYIAQDFFPLNTTLYVKDFKGNYPKFVYYFLQMMHLENFNSGAGVPTLNQNHLHKLKINIPDIKTQKKIAGVLSAYDDLIENNKRRIALLEKIAEEIYREWFVRMRFPGYKGTKFEKGVPSGWEIKPSIDVLDVLGGGTPKTDVEIFWNGEIPFFTPKDATDNFYVLSAEKALTQKGLENCSSRLFGKNTIFITARGTVGKMALSFREMAMNQSCYALLPKSDDEIYFYYLTMKNAITYVKGVSKSGVFDNIVIETFKIIPLLIPNETLITNFNEKIKPTFQMLGQLLESNENLVKTRDLLLSRLISGKLSVENLDIQFPPSMREEEKLGVEKLFQI